MASSQHLTVMLLCDNGFNEFYQKGCEEKSYASTGVPPTPGKKFLV